MLKNKQISDLFDMSVYSDKAMYLGKVKDVVLDVANKKINGLSLKDISPNIIAANSITNLVLPFRIVKEVEDIILVRHLPRTFEVETAPLE